MNIDSKIDLTIRRKGLADYLRSHVHLEGIVVCENPKFVYMKPGKTAGTSILRNGLEKRLAGIIHRKDNPQNFDEWLKNITDKELEEYFIFSVVRNPWDRMVSICSYFNIPFRDFLNNIDKYRRVEKINLHSMPISLYTHNQGIPFVDFVCRIECLQSDINLVYDKLGLEREILPVVNDTSHRHYSHYYSDRERHIVEELFSDDIKNYGYMFECKRRKELIIPLFVRNIFQGKKNLD